MFIRSAKCFGICYLQFYNFRLTKKKSTDRQTDPLTERQKDKPTHISSSPKPNRYIEYMLLLSQHYLHIYQGLKKFLRTDRPRDR